MSFPLQIMSVAFCISITLCTARASQMYDMLDSLQFQNEGKISSSDVYVWRVMNASKRGGDSFGQVAIYLEPDNVSCTHCVWADGGKYYQEHLYRFQLLSAPTSHNISNSFQELSNLDWTNSDIDNGNAFHTPTEDACKEACLKASDCLVGLWLSGTVRTGECWLSRDKATTPRTDFCGKKPGQECKSFLKIDSEVLGSPPSGIRSGVPLGGLSTGTVELRGDGTLREWTIHNAGPHGAAKIGEYPGAFFAAKIGNSTRILQTHPHESLLQSLKAEQDESVSNISYQGSYPFAKLGFEEFAQSENVITHLYGASSQKYGNMEESARPAIHYILAVKNTGNQSINVSFSFNLPYGVEIDQTRNGHAISPPKVALDAATCMKQCSTSSKCESWTYVENTKMCTLQNDSPLNMYQQGTTSGIASTWAKSGSGCVTNTRPGAGPMHGDLSLCGSSSVTDFLVGLSSGTAFSQQWQHFKKTGSVENGQDFGEVAGVSVSSEVEAGSNATLVITMAWNFPNRDHYNYPAAQFSPYGNHYAKLYPNGSFESAFGHLNNQERQDAISSIISDSMALQTSLFTQPANGGWVEDTAEIMNATTALPAWLQDILLNSVSHMRNTMWWVNCPGCAPTGDARINKSSFGIFRQYEAYDCPDLDSIHNDGERHIPYIMMFPDITRSKMAAWAHNQKANGMLAEQILNSKPDSPQGRIMSDSTSMFIIYVLELLRWSGDLTTLDLYYPVVKRAAQWQMSVSEKYGVPLSLETTYDILKFPSYELSAYASVFHLAAMAATRELATVYGDHAFAALANKAFTRAQDSIDKLQWNSQGGYYYAGSSECDATSMVCNKGEGIFSDAFYAQVLAYTVGLGDLLSDPKKLDSHLQQVWNANCVHTNTATHTVEAGCLNGLVIMTGRPVQLTDLQVWEMATHDHVSLSLQRKRILQRQDLSYLNTNLQNDNYPSLEEILAMSEGTGTSYSQRINDQWNVAGIKTNDGLPSITSHYGYHMTVWHTLFAITGQVADLSSKAKSLTFDPLFTTCDAKTGGPGYAFPVLLPNVLGTLECILEAGQRKWTFLLVEGSIQHLDELSVSGTRFPGIPGKIIAGTPLSWTG